MDGNKPKQRVEKPVEKQNNLTLNTRDEAPKEEVDESVFDGWKVGDSDKKPTKKYVTKAHAKKRRKIAR